MHKKDEVLINQLKLLQADFDNYRKRVDKERKEIVQSASAELVAKLLPVMADFDKALPLVQDEGIKIIYKNLMKALHDEGLEEIKTENGKFDTNYHEAVMTVSGKGEDNQIVGEVEKGYIFKGKVLKPSKVIVNRKI